MNDPFLTPDVMNDPFLTSGAKVAAKSGLGERRWLGQRGRWCRPGSGCGFEGREWVIRDVGGRGWPIRDVGAAFGAVGCPRKARPGAACSGERWWGGSERGPRRVGSPSCSVLN